MLILALQIFKVMYFYKNCIKLYTFGKSVQLHVNKKSKA